MRSEAWGTILTVVVLVAMGAWFVVLDPGAAGVAIGVGLLALALAAVGFEAVRQRRWFAMADALGFDSPGGRGFFSELRLEGAFLGRPAAIWTYTRGSGKNKSRWTMLEVAAPKANPYFELHASPEGLGAKLAKAFGGMDIEIGDAEFDRRFRLRGNDPEAARRVFDTMTRDVLVERAAKREFDVVNGVVHFHRRGLLADAREAQALLEAAARLAQAAEGAAPRRD